MAALNAKTFLADMLENDNFREYTFPEVFGGTTPDFALIQSCGKKINNDESDNVGRNSVRKSNGYVVGASTCCVGNVMDATNAYHVHSNTYSYWNMGTPVSDEGDGVRTSRGTITLIPNGVRVTNDSVYTTENHQLAISLVGGSDIGGAALVSYDSSIGSGTGGSQSLLMPFKGINLMMTMAGGGAKDTEHVGFNDSQGIVFSRTDTTSYRGFINGGYTVGTSFTTKGSSDMLWNTDTEQYGGSTSTSAFCCAAISGFPVYGSGDSNQPTKVRHAGIQETVGDAATDTLLLSLKTNGNNSLAGVNGIVNETHVYAIALNFNHVTQNNLTYFTATSGNPFTQGNQWAFTGGSSTRGTPELNDPYKIGGTNTDNWPTAVGNNSAVMSQRPTTFGMFLMNGGTGSNSVGIASNNFQYDGRVSAVDEDAGKPSYGHGIGYCIDTTAEVANGAGYPDTFVYTKPDFNVILPYYDPETGETYVGEVTAIYEDSFRKTGGVPNNALASGGSRVVELVDPFQSNRQDAFCTVTWDASGTITSVLLAASSGSVNYQQNGEYRMRFSAAYFSQFNVYISVEGVDGISYTATKGRTAITRDIAWGTDGSIELTQEGTSPWSYGQDAWEGHLIMASSDNAGSGVSGGGGGDFTIFYGTIPVTAVYLGSTELSAIAYGDIQV